MERTVHVYVDDWQAASSGRSSWRSRRASTRVHWQTIGWREWRGVVWWLSIIILGVLFFTAAIHTLCSEWLHIDRLRLDKFYMVIIMLWYCLIRFFILWFQNLFVNLNFASWVYRQINAIQKHLVNAPRYAKFTKIVINCPMVIIQVNFDHWNKLLMMWFVTKVCHYWTITIIASHSSCTPCFRG